MLNSHKRYGMSRDRAIFNIWFGISSAPGADCVGNAMSGNATGSGYIVICISSRSVAGA